MTKEHIKFANKTDFVKPKRVDYLLSLEKRLAKLEKEEVKKSVKQVIKKSQ